MMFRIPQRWKIWGSAVGISLICCAMTALAAQQVPSPIFHVSFDRSATPDIAGGATTVKGDYQGVQGAIANAVELKAGQSLVYGSTGNIDPKTGTLSLWFKLPISPSDKPDQKIVTLSLIRLSDHELAIRGSRLYFMTGATLPDEGWKWDYGLTYPLTKLSAAEQSNWIHVAVTWDQAADRRSLYVNGRQVGRDDDSPPLKHIRTSPAQIALGGKINVLLDEVTIWDKALDPSAIEAFYRDPTHKADSSQPPASQEDSWLIKPGLDIQKFGDGLVSPGQAFHTQVPLVNLTDKPQSGRITLTVLDIWEKAVGEPKTFEISLKPHEKSSVQADFMIERHGAFKIEAKVAVAGKTQIRDVTTFGVVPPGNPPFNSFFGTHVSMVKGMPELAQRLGYVADRVHDMSQFTYWYRMEPQRGQWAMNGYGSYEKLRNMNFEILGLFFTSPNWASAGPDGNIPPPMNYSPLVPTDEAALREYIDHAIKSFPAIKKWEMWNEPWVSMFWHGSPQQFAAMCKIIYQQAKKDRPDLQIFAPVWPVGPWSKQSLDAGLIESCDGISFHLYSGPGNPPQAGYDFAMKVRKLIGQYTKKPLPILCTEGGVTGSTFLRGLDGPDLPPANKRPAMSVLATTRQQVQYRVGMMAAGVEQYYEYFHQPLKPAGGMTRYWNYSTMEITNTPKYSTIANCILIWQLDGAHTCRRLDLAKNVPAYVFQRSDGSAVAVAWAENGAEFRWEGDLRRAVDVMGNDLPLNKGVSITAMPVYLHADCSADQLLQRLKNGRGELVKAGIEPAEPQNGGVEAPQSIDSFALINEVGPAKVTPLNLTANMSVVDQTPGDGKGGVTDEGPNNDLSMIKSRNVTWLGVPFELADKNGHPGMVTLRGKTFPTGPLSAGPFEVNQKARGLFFAHMGNWMSKSAGLRVATYVIQYADGKTLELPVIQGENIANWWDDQLETEESRPVALKHPDPLNPQKPYRFPRIWYWANPRPTVAIQSVSVRVDSQKITFALLGITVVK